MFTDDENMNEEEIEQALKSLNEKKRRIQILNDHVSSHRITEEKGGRFSTYVPDRTKPNGLRQIKKNTMSELEEAIVSSYLRGNSLISAKDVRVKPTFAEVVKQAILAKKGNLSATKNRKMGDLNTYIKDSKLGRSHIDKVTIDDIVDFMMDTIEKGCRVDKSRKKMKARNGDMRVQEQAAKNIRTIIIQGIRYASRKDWTTISGDKLFDILKSEMECDIYYVPEDNDLDHVLTDEQLRAVINQIDEMDYSDWIKNHSRDSAVVDQGILLTAYCGCRVGELCSLKWSDIKDGVMSLQRRESRGRVFDENGEPVAYEFNVVPGLKKRKSARHIPITDRMAPIFDRLRELTASYENPNNFIFIRSDGERIQEKTFSVRLKVLCTFAGVPERSIHKLRFSYVSRAAKTMPVKVLTEITGSTVRMVNYYNKNTAEIKEIREMMERAEYL